MTKKQKQQGGETEGRSGDYVRVNSMAPDRPGVDFLRLVQGALQENKARANDERVSSNASGASASSMGENSDVKIFLVHEDEVAPTDVRRPKSVFAEKYTKWIQMLMHGNVEGVVMEMHNVMHQDDVMHMRVHSKTLILMSHEMIELAKRG